MDRPGLNAQNMVISIPLRSITMTMFNIDSFVKIYADFYRKSISLLTYGETNWMVYRINLNNFSNFNKSHFDNKRVSLIL